MQANKNSRFLSFENLLVIVGGGDVDSSLLEKLNARGAAVVAADGGARVCASLGIVPAAIVGDMDSAEPGQSWPEETRIREIREQDTTDFEKCLYSCAAPLTVCLGVTGSRLDHSLASLDVLVRHSKSRKLALVGGDDLVLCQRGTSEFELAPGARVSLFAVQPLVFARSSGLEFDLGGVELSFGKRTGISNRVVSGRVRIVPERGVSPDGEGGVGQEAPYLLIVDKNNVELWLEGVLP